MDLLFKGVMRKYCGVMCGTSVQLAVAITLVGCGPGIRDEFPMYNATTGQEVMCYSGYYQFEEGAPQLRIAYQCRSACERHGFKLKNANDYYTPRPHAPDEDMKEFIPPECLP
jgi:hypothetical protein